MCAAAPQARVGLVAVVVAPVPAARQVARTGATVVGRRTRKCHVRHQPWRQRCVAGARSVWPRRFQLLCRGFCRRGSVRARHDRHRVTDCVRGLAQHAGRRCQRLTTRCCCWPRRVRNVGCLPSPRGVVLTVASASADFQGAYLTLPEVPPGDEVEVGGHLSCMLTPQPPRGHKRYNHTVVLTPRLHLLGREMAGAAHAVDVPSKHPVQFRPSDVPTCVAPGEEGFPITVRASVWSCCGCLCVCARVWAP